MRLAERLLEEGEYDLAALNAEYAAQLYVKGLLYNVSGEEWRGCGSRALLGALAVMLEERGYSEEARRIIRPGGSSRTWGRRARGPVYGALEYSALQARKLVGAARQLTELLRSVEEGILG